MPFSRETDICRAACRTACLIPVHLIEHPNPFEKSQHFYSFCRLLKICKNCEGRISYECSKNKNMKDYFTLLEMKWSELFCHLLQ